MKAVIIAAGSGSRLASRHNGMPKTLLKIGDRRIIDIILDAISAAGVSELVVVTGYESASLKDYITAAAGKNFSVEFCHNPDWKRSNGISVLAARSKLSHGEEFVLLMSDHIFEPRMLKKTIAVPLEQGEAVVAIDFKLDRIPDLDDGMKVRCVPRDSGLFQISGLNKKYTEYQAIDCGMFKLGYGFFDLLQGSVANGGDSLSDACNLLAAEGNMLGVDIGEAEWIDLDTPDMFSFHDLIARIQG